MINNSNEFVKKILSNDFTNDYKIICKDLHHIENERLKILKSYNILNSFFTIIILGFALGILYQVIFGFYNNIPIGPLFSVSFIIFFPFIMHFIAKFDQKYKLNICNYAFSTYISPLGKFSCKLVNKMKKKKLDDYFKNSIIYKKFDFNNYEEEYTYYINNEKINFYKIYQYGSRYDNNYEYTYYTFLFRLKYNKIVKGEIYILPKYYISIPHNINLIQIGNPKFDSKYEIFLTKQEPMLSEIITPQLVNTLIEHHGTKIIISNGYINLIDSCTSFGNALNNIYNIKKSLTDKNEYLNNINLMSEINTPLNIIQIASGKYNE